MSETFDVNVLLDASSAESPFHDEAARLLDSFVTGPRVRYVFWPVLLSYLRIATRGTVIRPPLSPSEAESNVDALLTRPHLLVVGPEKSFWRHYQSVSRETSVAGDLVPDAQIVALMRQQGISTIWTRDRDFRKFDGIRVRDPASLTS